MVMLRLLVQVMAWLICLGAAAPGQTTWHVALGSSGTGTASSPLGSVDAAVVLAQPGDTVEVGPGVYGERVNLRGKGLRLIAPAGPMATVLDGGQQGTVLTITQGEGSATRVEGFTLRNGAGISGGGLRIGNGAEPTLSDCVVSGNQAGSGGGVYVSDARPTLVGCQITNNTAEGPGGGLYAVDHAVCRLVGCTIRGNTTPYAGGGVAAQVYASVVLESCEVVENAATQGHGGGLAVEKFAQLTLVHGTVAGNVAGTFGGALKTTGGGAISRSVLWGNGAGSIDREGGVACAVSNSNVEGGAAGTGNVNVDPEFEDPAGGDYHLRWTSPNIDAATTPSDPGARDLDGEPRTIRGLADLGADEANPRLLDLTSTGGGGAAVRTVAFAYPGALAFSAFTLDANNATSFGQGGWFGLFIGLPELEAQFQTGAPPFVMLLDGQGLAGWVSPPGAFAGASGITVYGVALFVDVSAWAVLEASRPVAFTFP